MSSGLCSLDQPVSLSVQMYDLSERYLATSQSSSTLSAIGVQP